MSMTKIARVPAYCARLTAFVLAASVGSAAQAQPASFGDNLDAMVAYALNQHPALAVARQAVEASRARIDSAGQTSAWPSCRICFSSRFPGRPCPCRMERTPFWIRAPW